MSKQRVENSKTKAWEYYELGKRYNESLTPNQYNLVNTNIEFFAGNQWMHLPETQAMSKLPKPVFNILKRVASLFVASLTSSATAVSFEPLTYYDGENLNEKDMQALLINSVRRIADKYKITPLWLPLAEEDAALCRKLCRKCGRGRVMPRLQAGEIVSLLSGCLFSVCIRLHGAVFSSCAGIPAICLPYDPKVEAFADLADHHAVDMRARDLSPLSVIKIADHILSYRERLCASVTARAAEMRRACAADVETARRLWNK
jgi:hypothetical protein